MGRRTELDPAAWPERVEKHYALIPTICFNCESACGLVAYVDKEKGSIAKFEGNPVHPGSRGRTCAKGPATINQVNDTERILKPLKRQGKRGSGEFVEVSWEEALTDIGGRIRKAILDGRNEEVMYHVGRPGEDHFVLRMLQAWGVDGHNSHTNVCSASARLGYTLWMGRTGRRRITRRRSSCCCSRATSRPGTTSTRTRSAKNLVGGEVTEYTKLLAESREQALDRMVEEARARGADAIVGLRFMSSDIGDDAAEMLAYGTAVRLG